jgi:hypothetical protein
MARFSFAYTYRALDKALLDLPWIKSLGVDAVANYACLNPYFTDQQPQWDNYPVLPQSLLTYIDAVHAQGLKLLVNLVPNTALAQYYAGSPNYTNITMIVNAVKDHPALLGYMCDDESTGANYPISVRNQVYSFIKNLDPNPNHYVIEVHYNYFSDCYSKNSHDIFAIDNYPIAMTPSSWQTYLAGIKSKVNASDIVMPILPMSYSNGGSIPPAGRIASMWSASKNANFVSGGCGWYIWNEDATVNTDPVLTSAGYSYIFTDITTIGDEIRSSNGTVPTGAGSVSSASVTSSVSSFTGVGISVGLATTQGVSATASAESFTGVGAALGLGSLLSVSTAVLSDSIAGIGAQYSGRRIRAPNGTLIVIRDLSGNPKQF